MIDIIELKNEKDFNDFIEKDAQKVHVVKFGADWCGPCKILEQRLKNIDKERIGETLFAEVSIDDDETEAIAEKFGISNIPVLMYMLNKEVKHVSTGSVPLEEIYNRINEIAK